MLTVVQLHFNTLLTFRRKFVPQRCGKQLSEVHIASGLPQICTTASSPAGIEDQWLRPLQGEFWSAKASRFS